MRSATRPRARRSGSSCGTRDGVASLEVEDRGPGIAAAELSKAFERFRKGAATGGSGLGLALVQEIALRHGGRVTLRRESRGRHDRHRPPAARAVSCPSA